MLRSLLPLFIAERLQPSARVVAQLTKPAVPANDELRSMYRRRLNERNYEVRLLQLYQSTTDRKHMFKCRLKYRTLKEVPSYSALSYCWADVADKRELMVEGHTVSVPRNLLAALEQLWKMKKRLIWADYLCINQEDDEEKSGQVRMMDTIYAKAQRVYAWLGPESDDSELAMATLGASRLSDQPELPEEVEIACDAVIRLFSRSYFRRTWIIQEICRARNPILVCGQRWVHWGTMLKRLDMLGDSIAAQYAQTLISPLRMIRYRDLFRFRRDTETGLITLLIMSRRSLARDPRDKLYALLSLAKDGRIMIPTPNYSQTAEHVFFDTARCMIAEHDRTDVILLANRTRGERSLPSWAPDWANLKCQPPPWIVDSLSESCSLLNPPNKVIGNVLQVQGYRCDVISGFLDMNKFEETPEDEIPRSEDCGWESVVDNLWLGLTAGAEEPPPLLPVMKVLYQFCHKHATDNDGRTHLGNWVFHNSSRIIGCFTLQQHIEAYLDNSSIDDLSDADQELELQSVHDTIEEGFDRLGRLRMVFAITENGHLRVVYRASEKEDQIYILQNCPLPVVLRRGDHGHYQLVGEVLASPDFQSMADQRRPEVVSIE